MERPEPDLVARARRGDRSAFDTLAERHRSRLRGLAMRILGDDAAEDCVQTTLLRAWDTSRVDITGAIVGSLYAYDTSVVTFHARDFRFGFGLSVDGDRVLGMGAMSVEGFDGPRWTVDIKNNDSGATILAVPEPATLALLALGGSAMLTWRRRRGASSAETQRGATL